MLGNVTRLRSEGEPHAFWALTGVSFVKNFTCLIDKMLFPDCLFFIDWVTYEPEMFLLSVASGHDLTLRSAELLVFSLIYL